MNLQVLKDSLSKLLKETVKIVGLLNKETVLLARRLLKTQLDKKWAKVLYSLLENNAIALFISSLFISFIGILFGGLIENICFVIVLVNLVCFLVELLIL